MKGSPIRQSRRPRGASHSPRVPGAFLALLSLLSCAAPATADKSYQIAGVEIAAQLHEDGSLSVVESRTFDFRGSFRYAFREIPAGGRERFVDIQVSEGDLAYQLSDSEKPGTFQVTRRGDEIEVRWFFRAHNETRTFDLHYHVENLVGCHDDAALLYYQFIGDDWRTSSRNVRLAVTPPGPLGREAVRAWLHGPLWAQLSITDGGVLRAWCERLPERTFLKVRALYPRAAFPRAAAREGAIRAPVMEEEARWADEANRRRAAARESWERKQVRQALGKRVLPIISVLGLLGWILLYRRYGQRPELPAPLDVSASPPSRTPPALVGYLLHGREVGPRDLVATLLDLAQRGILLLREEPREARKFLGGTKLETAYVWELKRDEYRRIAGDLLAHEDLLIRLLFDELGGGADAIDLATLKKRSREMQKFFQTWQREVKQIARRRQYYDAASLRGMTYGLILGGVMMVLAVPGIWLFGPWAFVLMGAGLIVLLLSLLIAHRTPEGEIEARGWQALRRYLKSFMTPESGSGVSQSHLGDYLVYGAVLGLGATAYRRLAQSISGEQAARFVPWYITHGDGGISVGGLGSAFSAMVATATSSVSSAAGTGGGASGGGGGGAGGGGGGAG